MSDAGEPTKPSVVELCATALKDHFNQHTFKGPPALVTFRAEEPGVLAPLLRVDATIPQHPKNSCTPSFLLYDLENELHKDKLVYKHIAATSSVTPTALYGTSGAGKTRSVFEYLSHNHGLFFVASDHERNAGSKDLTFLLSKLQLHCTVVTIGDTVGSERNLVLVRYWLLILVYVRYAALSCINEKLTRDNKAVLTPFQWLLVQLYPEIYLRKDVFEEVVCECINRADLSPTKLPTRSDIKDLKNVKSLGVPFIDEAQVLLTELSHLCLSGTGDEKRSAFTALLRGFSTVARQFGTGYPVFSGTGLSIASLKEKSRSTAAKFAPLATGAVEYFIGFELLDVDAVKNYLRVFLALRDEDDDVRDEVLDHVAKWLRGRPRWTASFLELYLVRPFEKGYTGTRGYFSRLETRIIQALDRYISVMTTDGSDSNKRRVSWSAGDASAYATIVKAMKRGGADSNVQFNLKQAIFDFSVGGKSTIFGKTPNS
jgi:hypothetical protein